MQLNCRNHANQRLYLDVRCLSSIPCFSLESRPAQESVLNMGLPLCVCYHSKADNEGSRIIGWSVLQHHIHEVL